MDFLFSSPKYLLIACGVLLAVCIGLLWYIRVLKKHEYSRIRTLLELKESEFSSELKTQQEYYQQELNRIITEKNEILFKLIGMVLVWEFRDSLASLQLERFNFSNGIVSLVFSVNEDLVKRAFGHTAPMQESVNLLKSSLKLEHDFRVAWNHMIED